MSPDSDLGVDLCIQAKCENALRGYLDNVMVKYNLLLQKAAPVDLREDRQSHSEGLFNTLTKPCYGVWKDFMAPSRLS